MVAKNKKVSKEMTEKENMNNKMDLAESPLSHYVCKLLLQDSSDSKQKK